MKQAILDSALQIAQRDGWDQVTTRRITQEFGYTTSAIYHYLGGKDQLLSELRQRGFVQLKATLQAAVAQHPDDAPAQLRAISLAQWTFAHEHRSLYELMFGLAHVNCHGPSDGEMQKTGAVVQEVLGQLAGVSATDLFLHWWALVSGFVTISFNSRGDWRARVYQAYQRSIERFIGSI